MAIGFAYDRPVQDIVECTDVFDTRTVLEAYTDLLDEVYSGELDTSGDFPTRTDDDLDQDMVERVARDLRGDREGGLSTKEELAEAKAHLLKMIDDYAEALEALCDAVGAEQVSDGCTVVRDSYFEEHAQELAEDLGMVPDTHTWPTSYIDWERAARDLKMDYSCATVCGIEFWIGR